MTTGHHVELKNPTHCAISSDNVAHARAAGLDVAIAIIDDRPLVRDCIARGLAAVEPSFRFQHFATIASFDDADEDETSDISVILMCCMSSDAQAEERLAGLGNLQVARPSVNTIVLADVEEFDDILKAIESGVRGYIPTNLTLEVVAKAINLVSAGGIFIPTSVLFSVEQRGRAANAQSPDSTSQEIFTARQISVIEAMRRGKANKVIAYELNMCESTVKVHIRNIMKKIGARNRTQVAYILNTEPYKDVIRN